VRPSPPTSRACGPSCASDAYKPIKGWRIAYSMDLGFYNVDKDVVANTKAARDVFRARRDGGGGRLGGPSTR
jgi:amidase